MSWLKKLNDTEIHSANVSNLDANDIPTIKNPFGNNDSITQGVPFDCKEPGNRAVL